MKYYEFVLVVVLATIVPALADLNGEEACEGKGYNLSECQYIGCCNWDEGQCFSAVGAGSCNGGDGSGALLPDMVGWKNGVIWSDPPSGWEICGKVTTVFGIPVCVTPKAWSASTTKCNHSVNVFYQLLDNDTDGEPDDPDVAKEMVDKGYVLFVPATEADEENVYQSHDIPDEVGSGQVLYIDEIVPGTCDVPTNRGASATDRSTWSGAIDNTSGCKTQRDASTEEILHLITHAAFMLYPDLWGDSFSSKAGAAIKAANGNCGWGYQDNWIDPSSNQCEGRHAYDDSTCDEGCNVVEGIYWAVVSYIGGLYTRDRADDISREWLMGTPDIGMLVVPTGVGNAISLEAGSPGLYSMVSDNTSNGHRWLPSIMPDGNYQGNPGGVGSVCSDNPSTSYKHKRKKTRTCRWLMKKGEVKAKKICKKKKAARKKCPDTCAGKCFG